MKRFMISFAAALFAVGMLQPQKAYAIKAWSNKQDVKCSVCHLGPPGGELTRYGQDFQRRAHSIAGDEVAKDFMKFFSFNAKLRFHDSNQRYSTFENHAFSIYGGGPISKHFSTFVELYFAENRGKTTGAANEDFNRTKLADLYLEYISNRDKDVYTTVKVGQFSPSQLLLYWQMGPRSYQTRPYIVNNANVSPNTYRPFMRNPGVAVGQRVNNFYAEVGVLNGTGSSPTNSVDTNGSKDVFATLDYTLDGHGSAAGVYGYKGRGLIMPSSGPAWENDFHRYGAFGKFRRSRFTLTGAATRGQEQLTAGRFRAHNLGVLAGLDVYACDRLTVFGRYDYFDPNVSKANDQLSGPVLGAAYQLFDSGRVTFEYHKQGKYVVAPASKAREVLVEIAYMF